MTFARSLARTLGFAALYVLATYAGRLTVMDDTSLSLVWPAAGILAVWFVAQRESRWRWLDIVALVAITLAVNTMTGAPLTLACWFVAANLVQAFLFAHLLDRWLPDLWRRSQLTQLSELWLFIAAAVTSTLASALIGPTGVWAVTGTYSYEGAAVWLARNSVSIMLIGVAARRIGFLVQRGSLGPRARAAWTGASAVRRFEYAAVLTVSTGAYFSAFGMLDGLPVAFALIVVTVWAALRLHTTFVILHDLTFGTAAVLFTLHGDGPFAQIASHPIRALVAQLFVGTVAVVGLALALGRDERVALMERLRASERAATEQAALLTTIVDGMSDGLGVVDAAGRFVLRNPAAGRLLGGMTSPTGQVADSAYYGLYHPDGTPLTDADLPHRRVLDGHEVRDMDILVRNSGVPEGRIINLNATRLPGNGHVVLVYHDVTADRRHRDELMRFAGVVGHDLLNPLSTIEGWSEELTETVPGARDGVVRIRRAAGRMRTLIDGLLYYTTARDAALAPDVVDLGAVVGDIAVARLDHAQSASVPAPRIDVGPMTAVYADPLLVRQLLENLISNAIKFAAPGAIPHLEVSAEVTGDGFVRVAVTDYGIGIPAGQHEAVFGNFHRAHRTAGYAGHGLGLAICQRIVERHGGAITACDNPGGTGTRITFTLPGAQRREPALV